MDSGGQEVKIRVYRGGAWERINGNLRYMPDNLPTRNLLIPLAATYDYLVTKVCLKYKVDVDSGLRLTYLADGDIVEVCDDNDVLDFLVLANNNMPSVTRLYVLEHVASGGCDGVSGSGSNNRNIVVPSPVSQNVQQPEYFMSQYPQFQTQQFGMQNIQNLGYGQMPGYFVFPSFPQNPNLVGCQPIMDNVGCYGGRPIMENVSPVPNFSKNKGKNKQVCSEENVDVAEQNLFSDDVPNFCEERDLLNDQCLRPRGEKLMSNVFGDPEVEKHLDLTDDEEDDKTEETSFQTNVSVDNLTDKFWLMPPPLSFPVPEKKIQFLDYLISHPNV